MICITLYMYATLINNSSHVYNIISTYIAKYMYKYISLTTKLLKKVRKLEFHRSYFSYYHTSNIVFDIIRKPVYLSLN